jgi:hypothetical protein
VKTRTKLNAGGVRGGPPSRIKRGKGGATPTLWLGQPPNHVLEILAVATGYYTQNLGVEGG